MSAALNPLSAISASCMPCAAGLGNSKNTSVVVFVDLVQRVAPGVSHRVTMPRTPHPRSTPGVHTPLSLQVPANSAYAVLATHGGFVELLVKLNDKVEAGQGVAIQRNTFGEVVAEYTSGVTGEVACHSSRQVVRPNREPHLMTACKTVVDADVCVGLVRHSFGTSDFHLFPTPTLRQFDRARN